MRPQRLGMAVVCVTLLAGSFLAGVTVLQSRSAADPKGTTPRPASPESDTPVTTPREETQTSPENRQQVVTEAAQAPAAAAPAPASWAILFRADDPSVWDTHAKGAKGEPIAIPLRFAPARFRYLRLRRMDTGEALILPLTPDELQNGAPAFSEDGYWWNGANKDEYRGRHLGIVQGPRRKFPEPAGLICVMHDGWDGFAGSGFGHKYGVNDAQHYCWRGQEIKRTVFEIAVSEGPLSPNERRCLVSELTAAPPKEPGGTSTRSPQRVAAPATSSARVKFDKIHFGMTEDEVTAILGPPSGSGRKTETINGVTTRSKTLTWRQSSRNLTMVVIIRNEKVGFKNWIQINPPQP